MTLRAIRQNLANDLAAAGVDTEYETPQAFTPPGAVLVAGDPYLQPGINAYYQVIRFSLYLFVDASPRDEEELDALLSTALQHLWDEQGAFVENIEQPTNFSTDAGRAMYGTKITFTVEVEKGELI